MTMQKVEIALLFIAGLLAVATARPGGLPFLTFENGNFGVNFGGYKAWAGLGGLLSGDRTQGGLQAGASTPFGPKAAAGLGGALGGNGQAGGQLFAGADLGQGNAQAAAGLGGVVAGSGHAGGRLFAGAGLGHGSPQAAAGLGGAVNGNGNVGGELHAKAGLGHDSPSAAAGLGGEVGGYGVQGGLFAGASTGGGGPAVVKTVGSHSLSSVQPSFVEKTVQKELHSSVPNVEIVKSFGAHISESAPSVGGRISETEVHQVPTVVKTVQTQTYVPPQPNLVSVEHVEKFKTRVTPKKQKTRVSTIVRSRVHPSVQSGVVVHKTVYPAANLNVQKYVETRVSPVQEVQYYNQGPIGASAAAGIGGSAGFYGGGFGGGYGSGFGGGYAGGYGQNYYANPQPSPQLFDDIFNIPISTLTAVNQLLRNKGK